MYALGTLLSFALFDVCNASSPRQKQHAAGLTCKKYCWSVLVCATHGLFKPRCSHEAYACQVACIRLLLYRTDNQSNIFRLITSVFCLQALQASSTPAALALNFMCRRVLVASILRWEAAHELS